MTVDLLLCDECAKHLEDLFPEIYWITDGEQTEEEHIRQHLNLAMLMKKVEKCEVCKKRGITVNKSHFFETQKEFEESFIRLLREGMK